MQETEGECVLVDKFDIGDKCVPFDRTPSAATLPPRIQKKYFARCLPLPQCRHWGESQVVGRVGITEGF